MSEFLAEARILVRPDTTRFRAELEASLAAATKGVAVQIPVAATPVVSGAAVAAKQAQAQAEQQITTSTREATRAQQQQLGMQETLTRSTAQLTAAQRAEVKANELLARSASQVAEAESLASLKSTELAANRTRLAATSRAVATAERAVLVALASENEALVANARATLANLQAQELAAQERVKVTIAANAHAAALQREAASEALVARGAGATALSLAGARGATLAASGGFLIGAAAATFFAESLQQAVDAEETFRRASFLLGDQLAGQLSAQAQGIGDAFAIDDDDVLKFETQIGKILKAVGLADDRIAAFSPEIVKLAADIAAFNRVSVDDALKAIQSGLAGNTRGLRQYGVLLDNTSISQRALAQTGKESADELTRQELVLARLSLIQDTASFQAGAFADQQSSLQAQSQRLRVNFEELQETIGKGLVPAVGGLVEGLNETFDSANRAASGIKRFGSALPIIGDEIGGLKVGGLVEDLFRLNTQAVLLGPVFGPIALGMKLFGDETEETGEKLTFFDSIAGSVTTTLGGLAGALEKVKAGLPTQRQREDLSLTLAQSAGDDTQELALLRAREQRQQAFLDRLLKSPAVTQNQIKLQQQAADNLQKTQDQIQGILDQQAADAKSAAAAAKTAATEIERAQEEQDRALLQVFAQRRQDVSRQADAAATTANLQDDIRAQDRIQALIKIQITKVRSQIKDEETRASAIRELRIALIKSRQEEESLRRERAQAASARRDEIQNLNIQIAEERGNESALERAIRIRINTLNKQIKAAKGDQVKMKQLILERERLKSQLEELNKQQEETTKQGKTFAQKSFEFAQSLQGFSANLLGNLIPGFATGGLVGNTAAAGPAAGQPFDVGAGVRQQGALQTGLGATVKPVQVDTTNALLRQILAALQGRHTQPPEIAFNRGAGSSNFDTL